MSAWINIREYMHTHNVKMQSTSHTHKELAYIRNVTKQYRELNTNTMHIKSTHMSFKPPKYACA